MASNKRNKKDEDFERIRRRAEMIPSDDEDNQSSEDEMSRIRRRAEMVPSDDDSDDESVVSENDYKVGAQCALVDGSSDDDDGSSDEEDEEDEIPQKKRLVVDENPSDDDDDSEEEEEDEEEEGNGNEFEDFSSDEEEEEREESRFTRPIREVPLNERLALKMNGGESNPYSQQRKPIRPTKSHWEEEEEEAYDDDTEETEVKTRKKRPKHAPMEQSTKWAVGRHREVIETKKTRVRDPRFEEMGSTPLNGKLAEEAYSFLDDKRKTELKTIHKEIRKERKRRGGRVGTQDSKIELLKAAELRLKQVDTERLRRVSEKSALSAWKNQEKAAVAGGKQPFYLKRKAAKEMLLEARFDGLRKGKGGKKRVEKILERKRKKTVAKERKWVPDERRY